MIGLKDIGAKVSDNIDTFSIASVGGGTINVVSDIKLDQINESLGTILQIVIFIVTLVRMLKKKENKEEKGGKDAV